jgi:hypothetical protein
VIAFSKSGSQYMGDVLLGLIGQGGCYSLCLVVPAVYEVSHWSCCPDCCSYRYRGVSSTGMSFRPSTYSSTGGGYNDRDDDRYGGSYGGSRGGRDDYDSYGGGSRDGDRYRDDDRSGRDKDRYKDDGYGGDRDRYVDDYSTKGSFNDKYESGATSDRDRDRGYDDDDRYSSRQSNKAKGAPPAYEDTVQTDDQEDDR